ncbi:MAG: Hsp33 family molecular chaperone HslO [Gammaproteobacteria bacterium]|nr:Hsp33 family molecular chaperone HslO [Gammaproteobacteria bacterium]
MNKDTDTLQRFLFEHAAIRGEVVHLDHSWLQVLQRHDYPPTVRDLLGESLTAAVLLSATIKTEGTITIQVQASGSVTLLVAEISVAKNEHGEIKRTLRGVANWNGEIKPGNLKDIFGDGQIVITIEPSGSKERFQGIVALEGEDMAEALVGYLKQSEQLETRMWLESSEQGTAGLLIQRMPASDQTDDEDWNRISQLATTISRDELLQLASRELIHRLFHEEDIRLFDHEGINFYCNCSRDRVANMLRTLGRDELMTLVKEQNEIHVACEFCKQDYGFDIVDIEQILQTDTPFPSPERQQ